MKSYLFFLIYFSNKNSVQNFIFHHLLGDWTKTLKINQLEIRFEINNYLVVMIKYKIPRLNHENQRFMQTGGEEVVE